MFDMSGFSLQIQQRQAASFLARYPGRVMLRSIGDWSRTLGASESQLPERLFPAFLPALAAFG